MKGLMESLGGKVQVKEIPLHQYCTFIKAELAAAMDKATFQGMRDSGPNKANEEELERFLVREGSGLFWCPTLGSILASLPGWWQMEVLARTNHSATFLALVRSSSQKRQRCSRNSRNKRCSRNSQRSLSTTSQSDKRSRKRKRNRKKCRKGKSWPQAQKMWT